MLVFKTRLFGVHTNKNAYLFLYILSIFQSPFSSFMDESIIRRWRTNESKLIEAENLPKRMVNNASPMGKKFGNRCRSIGGGRKPKCQEIEQELLSWIDEKRAKALHVSRKMIKERALIIFEEKKAKESDHFSASDGWISNFMRRNGLYRQFALEYIRVWCSQKKNPLIITSPN